MHHYAYDHWLKMCSKSMLQTLTLFIRITPEYVLIVKIQMWHCACV